MIQKEVLDKEKYILPQEIVKLLCKFIDPKGHDFLEKTALHKFSEHYQDHIQKI